ncbi:hypothetical protein AUJ65_05865 [Candidatus Micrarchaeota archaeon CG1_02_51_15]|nr:MAG: hypothetical protein AUJ65_05865 [Candidatus Micrarchaeota archaeon CG1_02_51_15]
MFLQETPEPGIRERVVSILREYEMNFIKGKKLSELFFKEIVEPILKEHYPNLKYSAGLLGPGSDVLGFDTPRSTDHDWGPRLVLFLEKKTLEKNKLFPKC